MPRPSATRRNVIAQAHSLRGPAGSGAHGARSEPRQRVEVCGLCAEEMAACGCPTFIVIGGTAPLEPTRIGWHHTLETTR